MPSKGAGRCWAFPPEVDASIQRTCGSPFDQIKPNPVSQSTEFCTGLLHVVGMVYTLVAEGTDFYIKTHQYQIVCNPILGITDVYTGMNCWCTFIQHILSFVSRGNTLNTEVNTTCFPCNPRSKSPTLDIRQYCKLSQSFSFEAWETYLHSSPPCLSSLRRRLPTFWVLKVDTAR